MTVDTPVLAVRELVVDFPDGDGGRVPVVKGVSFDVRRGEALGFVGESGSGKTMTARSLLGLVPRPGQVRRGSIQLEGRELAGLSERQWRAIRGQQIGMVFQDALSGLNPIRTIGSLLVEAVRAHGGVSRAEARRRAVEALAAAGVPKPAERLDAYAHQLSGGLRQRVMIALAIVNRPTLIIADEPTTALDATIQAQILDLLGQLLSDSALLLITHDLGVAAAVCDRVAVVYAGELVEVGDTTAVLGRPRHPYTAGLLGAVPTFSRQRGALRPIEGAPPAPADVPLGCPFTPRCRNAVARCPDDDPALTPLDGRLVACWNPHDA